MTVLCYRLCAALQKTFADSPGFADAVADVTWLASIDGAVRVLNSEGGVGMVEG
jgi:hypothetical protein